MKSYFVMPLRPVHSLPHTHASGRVYFGEQLLDNNPICPGVASPCLQVPTKAATPTGTSTNSAMYTGFHNAQGTPSPPAAE